MIFCGNVNAERLIVHPDDNPHSSHYIDIVTGGNGVFYATKGYDFCTGLGSPNVANIVSAAEKE